MHTGLSICLEQTCLGTHSLQIESQNNFPRLFPHIKIKNILHLKIIQYSTLSVMYSLKITDFSFYVCLDLFARTFLCLPVCCIQFMGSFIIYWVKVHCHLFVLMLKVSQICLVRAIQASLSFYTSS